MKIFVLILTSIISIVSCKKNEKQLNIASLEIRTTYVAVDTIEYTLYHEKSKLLSKRYYVTNEINLAKQKNINVNKSYWICDLDSVDLEMIMSKQFIIFQRECFKTLLINYPYITNDTIFSIFKKLNSNILNSNSVAGHKSIENFKNHFKIKLRQNAIEPCRKSNLEKLFLYLDTLVEKPNMGIYFYDYSKSNSTPESSLLSNPFFKLSISSIDNKKSILLEYLFDTNLNYSSN